MKKIFVVLLIVMMMVMLTGCLPGDSGFEENSAGFFWGVLHGWLAPVSLIISIFNDQVNMYEIFNTGLGYNFGFYIAIIGGFGGLSLSRRKRKKDNSRS